MAINKPLNILQQFSNTSSMELLFPHPRGSFRIPSSVNNCYVVHQNIKHISGWTQIQAAA